MITLPLVFAGVLLVALGCYTAAFWVFAGAFYRALVGLVKIATHRDWRDPSGPQSMWAATQALLRNPGEDVYDTFWEPRQLLWAVLLYSAIQTALLLAAVWDVGRVAGYF